jgi:hypothetical protein
MAESDQRTPSINEVAVHCQNPACSSDLAGIRILTPSTVTFRCPVCRLMWSTDMASLSREIKESIARIHPTGATAS